MFRRSLVAIVLALGVGAGATAYAFGSFYYDGALGTVYPAPATAALTCYAVDSGFSLVAATPRGDVLATFVRRDAQGREIAVCFLRPPVANPDWIAPTVATPTPSLPAACPGFPTPPFAGAVCHPDGGWR